MCTTDFCDGQCNPTHDIPHVHIGFQSQALPPPTSSVPAVSTLPVGRLRMGQRITGEYQYSGFRVDGTVPKLGGSVSGGS